MKHSLAVLAIVGFALNSWLLLRIDGRLELAAQAPRREVERIEEVIIGEPKCLVEVERKIPFRSVLVGAEFKFNGLRFQKVSSLDYFRSSAIDNAINQTWTNQSGRLEKGPVYAHFDNCQIVEVVVVVEK